jgi:enamine deaminase RidA (YjgF/YER057c/UK114 family)
MTSEPKMVGALPAPRSRRAGDFVFVSGLLVEDTEPSASPWLGPSPVGAQTSAILAELKGILADASTSLDRVTKVDVFLAFEDDYYEFNNTYREVLGDWAPARTTVVVGDDLLASGARVMLTATAVVSGAPFDLVAVNDPTGPSALEVEHAVAAVRAGPFVFCSGFPATDFRSGLAVPDVAGAYHGSSAALQATHVFDHLESTLAAAGSSLELGVKVQFYESDLRNFREVDRLWGEYFEVPPTRSSMACRGFTVPGAEIVANLLAIASDAGIAKAETRAGIPWHPIDIGKANFTPGITAGPWLFTAGQIPVPDIESGGWTQAPSGLRNHFSNIEIQTEATLDLLEHQLAANGFGMKDVVNAIVYLVDARRDARGFARAWARRFAETDRPALAVVPSKQANGDPGVMVKGPLLEIDLMSWKAGA